MMTEFYGHTQSKFPRRVISTALLVASHVPSFIALRSIRSEVLSNLRVHGEFFGLSIYTLTSYAAATLGLLLVTLALLRKTTLAVEPRVKLLLALNWIPLNWTVAFWCSLIDDSTWID